MMKILNIDCGKGSLQNPAWSPDGKQISLTIWRGGYNKEPADIAIFDLATEKLNVIIADGNSNCSQPGSCWSPALNAIVYSSDKTKSDWPHIYYVTNQHIEMLPRRTRCMGYEPSWSPDGKQIVYEQHRTGQEGSGRIVVYDSSTKSFRSLTRTSLDCRQPNWSHDGKTIIWQKNLGHDNWMLQLYDVATKRIKSLTRGTDATFSPDNVVLYSDNDGHLRTPEKIIYKQHNVYTGAASWGVNGIVCETCPGDPDSRGNSTKIGLIR